MSRFTGRSALPAYHLEQTRGGGIDTTHVKTPTYTRITLNQPPLQINGPRLDSKHSFYPCHGVAVMHIYIAEAPRRASLRLRGPSCVRVPGFKEHTHDLALLAAVLGRPGLG